MEIQIGTSGYSFEDWRGAFYPPDIEKGKMLDYYVRHFHTVEINSTYYRIPHPIVMSKIAQKTPQGFEFIVKVPQSFTHIRQNLENDRKTFLEALKPLEESNKLSGLLAQFPYSFKCNSNTLDYVCMCKEAVAPHQLFVEFRHVSWVNRTMYDRLKAEGIGYVCVDEPPLPGLLKPDLFATTDTAYIRMHGRNAEQWWNGGELRYDYKYSPDILQEWLDKIDKMAAKGKVKKLFMFFNNCHQGKAVADAVTMKQLIK